MAEKSEMGSRQSFLDILRVAATCAVVLLHTVTGVMDTTDMSAYPLEKTVFLVVMDLITWCVPIFVLISGYLFLNPAKELSFQRMLTKYCRRILLALFLFGVPYACLELIATEHTFRLGMAGEAFLMVCKGQSWSHMWYLYLILILYLITPALKAVLKRIPRSLLYAVLVFLLAGSSILPFLKKLCAWEDLVVLPDGGIYLFYYLCGYLFACGPNREQKGGRSASRRILTICLVLLFAGMVCSRLIGNYTVQMAYNYPFTVAVSLILVWLLEEREGAYRQKNTVFWKNAGELCFTIYLVHPVFVNIFYKFLHVTPLDFPVFLSLPGFFAAVLLLSILTAWILCRIPLLRKYVL